MYTVLQFLMMQNTSIISLAKSANNFVKEYDCFQCVQI